MKPLRAYLLLQLPSGEINVSTHRDLESIEVSWRERDFIDSTAALHIGFWRPDTEDFIEALKCYPGRILLSGSAVHALPSSFTSSASPISSAGNLPLHLALSGWDYEIEDVIPSKALLEEEPKFDRSEITCEWMIELSDQDEKTFESALDYGIFDDKSYLELEDRIPTRLREILGRARFQWVSPITPTANTIFDYLAFTPPWFQSLPIAALSLPTRAANVLASKSVSRIGDLCLYEKDQVLKFDNLGKKSMNDIGECLLSVLNNGITGSPLAQVFLHKNLEAGTDGDLDRAPLCLADEYEDVSARHLRLLPSKAATLEPSTLLSFSEAMEASIALLTEKERLIMSGRMGADGKKMTLEDISKYHNVSRERIRQIETKSLAKIKRSFFWISMGKKIREIISEREEGLVPHGLEVIEPAFEGAAKSPNVLEYVLERFVEPALHLVRESGLTFISELTHQEWTEKTKAAVQLLESLVDTKPTVNELRNMVDGLLVGRGAELREELWRAATNNAHFVDGRLVRYGSGANSQVFRVLEASEAPIHYSEIFNRLHEEGYDCNLRRIHAAASEVGLLYGRGVYGTMRHFPLNVAETRLIISEAEDMIEYDSSGRQWHAREIYDRLEAGGIDCGGNLTPYLISITLSQSKRLIYLGRMIWASKSSGAKGAASRLDMHQAVVSILIENGKPMPSSEIKEKLEAERGLNNYFQIQQEGLLVRVGPGTWGLMNRDVPFSDDELISLINAFKAVLIAKEKGIHSSELIDEIAIVEPVVRRVGSPILLLALAQKAEGLSVSLGQHLYLTEWEEARRMGVSEAVKYVLENAKHEGVTNQEGMAGVAELIERPFPSNMTFGQASFHLGAVYDESSKRWRWPLEEEVLD